MSGPTMSIAWSRSEPASKSPSDWGSRWTRPMRWTGPPIDWPPGQGRRRPSSITPRSCNTSTETNAGASPPCWRRPAEIQPRKTRSPGLPSSRRISTRISSSALPIGPAVNTGVLPWHNPTGAGWSGSATDEHPSAGRHQPHLLHQLLLPLVESRDVEVSDQVLEHPMPVDLRPQVEEHRAEADGGSVHEHELPGRFYGPKAPQVGMHALGHFPAVDTRAGFLDAPRPVFQQRAIDEARPPVQHVDGFLVEILEAPGLVGMDRERPVVALQRVIEIDDALDEFRAEDPDAAVVQQIDRSVGPDGVVAQMRVAVDYAVVVEGHIPGAEHVLGDPVAHRLVVVRLDEGEQRRALEPGHGEKPAGRKRLHAFGHMDLVFLGQHGVIEAHVPAFECVVQLLAQARCDLGVDLVGDDGFVVALVDGEDEAQLAEVG